MMSSNLLVATCAIALCCNVALLVIFVKYNGGERYYATIDSDQEVNVVLPDNFLSLGIDASEIQEYQTIDFSSSKLRDLASALSPARIRLGGTMSERLIFNDLGLKTNFTCEYCHFNNESVCFQINKLCKKKFLPFFIMSGHEWSLINEFCVATKLKLLFSFNFLLRDDNGHWNDMNAIQILKYSKHHHYNIDWQLGNEPNSYKHVFNYSITPKEAAHDFARLRKLLDKYGFKKALLVGPDTTRPQPNRPSCLEYMVDFLKNASKYINVRSWHQYYLNSRTAKLEDFWNPDTFDLLEQQILTMKNSTSSFSHIPMWLTETSSSYGGGAPGLSDSYAATPLWIDKLGLSAKYNITTVFRQSFIGGNYSLINKKFEPNPDWWASVIYKRLVGNKVLSIDCNSSRHQRLYVHCVNSHYTNDTSAITVYGMNLEMTKSRFYLNGSAFVGENLSIDEYILSAKSNNRRAKAILLNGRPLLYESSVPEFTPRKIKYGRYVSMPPYSIAFWVVKNTAIKSCDSTY